MPEPQQNRDTSTIFLTADQLAQIPRTSASPPPASSSAPFWQQHPTAAALTRGALNTLPVIGATVGGMMATPETLGIGAPAGVVAGAGVGKGARDLAAHALGLESSTPTEKAEAIGHEMEATAGLSALAAAAPLLRIPAGKVLQFAGKTLQHPTTPLKMAGSAIESLGERMASPAAAPAAATAAAPAAAVASEAPATAEPAIEKTAAGAGSKLTVSAGEFAQAQKWLHEGVSESDVLDRLNAARAFNAKFGGQLPSADEVRTFVSKRNETGKWE